MKQLSRDEQDYAIRTWRYLRLAMVGLALGLLVSVVYEWRTVGRHCLQDSLSAYYYTPVRGYLVAAMLSIGVCLFCLKGSTATEDALLNLAGMFAGVVALVPTPGTGDCSSVPGTTAGRLENIANNVTALFAVGVFGLIVFVALARRARRVGRGYIVGALLWAIAAGLFFLDRTLFAKRAHDSAAYLMFGCIFGVVVFNARAYSREPGRSLWNRYTFVAAGMVASLGLIVGRFTGWDHWTIAIETSFITLFTVFWTIQTRELWHEGIRSPSPTSG